MTDVTKISSRLMRRELAIRKLLRMKYEPGSVPSCSWIDCRGCSECRAVQELKDSLGVTEYKRRFKAAHGKDGAR